MTMNRRTALALAVSLAGLASLPAAAEGYPARLASFGTVTAGGAPARLAQSNTQAYARYARLVKDFGIQAE